MLALGKIMMLIVHDALFLFRNQFLRWSTQKKRQNEVRRTESDEM